MFSASVRRGLSPRCLPVFAIFLATVLMGPASAQTPGAGSPADTPGTDDFAPPATWSIAPLLPAPDDPRPVYVPPTQAGWEGAWLNPRNMAPYLAFHKARAAARQERLREEPSPNQAFYNARYYDIDVNLNPTSRILTGVVTIRSTITEGPLQQIELDLGNNMTVSSVTCGGAPATYTHANAILSVNLDRPYQAGEDAEIVVSYAGNPAGESWGWNTQAGQPMIWTLSEAFGARTWWPCKDYPYDKADSVDIRVTVPTGLITASNGTLRQQTDNGVTAFSWWHESYPISTYLVSLAIHTYHVYSDWYAPQGGGDPVEIRFYNYDSSIPEVEPVQARVKDMMAAFAERFGEYPFLREKYGHAEFPWSGGMEHQTCTSLGYFGEGVVAHELGHQWFGDDITCASFHDIWLNEGWATFTEAIWQEHLYGRAGYMAEMDGAAFFGPGTIWVPDTSNWNRIFDSNLSYNKASWIPHMLRGMMGDTVFRQFIDLYREQYSGRSASTEDFQRVAEEASGLDLEPFFNQWIYGEYYPIYRFDWAAAAAGDGWDITLDVEQGQTWQLFTMPIKIRAQTEDGPREFTIQNSQRNEQYVLHVDALPTAVEFDPDRWILRQVMSPCPVPTFERNILLVNGVEWSTYGTEITSAYQDQAFSGSYEVDFWDCFPEPSGGYPSVLPEPRGHGTVPGEILAQYRHVIWVGNNIYGDLPCWMDTPILSYLEHGGNVFLMTRMASDFLSAPYLDYLGITWAGTGQVNDCIATQSGLTDIRRLGSQSYVSGTTLMFGPETTMFYKAVSGHFPNWGLGMIRRPANGGTYNPDGGRFALLNGRPYRWNHADLRTNVEYILANLIGVGAPGAVGEGDAAIRLNLEAVRPNPSSAVTEIRFDLPREGAVKLEIHDVAGRLVRTLADGRLSAGAHLRAWDGRDHGSRSLPSGVYYARLSAEGQKLERKIIRLR